MKSINIYDCKVGDIVLTGDSYGMDVCICVGFSRENGINFVKFVEVLTGRQFESGYSSIAYADDCYFICRSSPGDLEKFMKKWNLSYDL